MLTENERQELRGLIEAIDPTDFEYFVADCFEADGWITTVTVESGDEAIDFIAEKKRPVPQRVPVQVKHREDSSSRLGSNEIREYQALDEQDPSYTSCMVAANTKFTPQAKGVAYDRQEFSLFDVDDLINLIEKHGLEEELRLAARGEYRGLEPAQGGSTSPNGSGGAQPGLSLPSLPSASAGLAWLFSGDERDRWRNVVSLSLLLLVGSFIVFVLTQPAPELQWAFTISGWLMVAGYIVSTYGVFKDMRIGWRKSLIVRIYGTLMVAALPVFGPLIYLKLRDPTQ